MTANQHFDRIFHTINLNTGMNRLMFIAGYEAALNEMMDKTKSGTAFNLALSMYTESVKEDLETIRDKNAEARNNETKNSV